MTTVNVKKRSIFRRRRDGQTNQGGVGSSVARSVSSPYNSEFNPVILQDYAKKVGGNLFKGTQNIEGDLNVLGNITQTGSAYVTHAEHVNIESNLMQLNLGETAAQITGVIPGTSIPFSGQEINRGGGDPYYFGVVEGAKPLFKLGKKSSLVTLAAREDSPLNNGVMLWDDANHRMKAVAAAPDSDKLGSRVAADYWHKDNSNKLEVNWYANNLKANSLNLGNRFEGDLNTLPDDIPLHTFSTRLFGSSALNRPLSVNVSDGIIQTYNWNGSKYALQIAHDIDGTGSAFRHRSGTGTSWSVWSKYFTSLNANRSDIDWQGHDLTAHRNIYIHGHIGSPDYASGLTGADWRITKSGNGELDNLEIRKGLIVHEIIVARERSVNGGIITSVANGTAKSIEGDVITLKGRYNSFIVGDRVRMQEWENSTRYFEAEVTEVDGMTITLGNYTTAQRPQANDDLVQWGHKTDASRQNFLYQTARGSNAAYFSVLHGVNSSSLTDKEVLRMGNLGGYANDGFGMASKYGGKTYFELSNTTKQIAGITFDHEKLTAGNVQIKKVGDIINTLSGTPFAFYNSGNFTLGKGQLIYDVATNKLSLGAAVTLAWSQITDKSVITTGISNAQNAADNAYDLAETKVTTEQATTITKNTITSTYISGLNLEVGNQIAMGVNATIAWDKVTGGQSAIDAIQIGGRNLIRNSNLSTLDLWNFSSNRTIHTNDGYTTPFPLGINIWLNCKMSQNISLQPGTYTLSAYVRSYHSDTDKVLLRIGNESKEFTATGGTYERFVFTVTLVAAVSDIGIECVGGADIMVVRPQLEKGNKTTDWTPSPEDVDAIIATKVTTNQATQITKDTVTTSYVNAMSLTIDKGTLGGFHVDDQYLWSGTKQSANTYSVLGMTLYSAGAIRAKEFRIDTTGKAFFKGELQAPSGDIGGLNIENGMLRAIEGSGSTKSGLEILSGSTPSINLYRNGSSTSAMAAINFYNGTTHGGYLRANNYASTNIKGIDLYSFGSLNLESAYLVKLKSLTVSIDANIFDAKDAILTHNKMLSGGGVTISSGKFWSEGSEKTISTNSSYPTNLALEYNSYWCEDYNGDTLYIRLPNPFNAREGTRISIGTNGRNIGIVASSSAGLRWDSRTRRASGTYSISSEVEWVHWRLCAGVWTRCNYGNN